jgi:transposase
MRGDERDQDGMFSYISLEQRVPQDHPLRAVRKLTDAVLRTLSPEFDALYADSGRPSIAPEYILRALLLQVFYSVRSERLLVEQIDYNLLFRWFVGLGMDDAVWNHAVFSKNRDRLLTSDVAQQFFAEVNKHARRFMSDEHFTVDGTLIQAWASQKSFRSKDGSDDGDGANFHGQKRSNKTHESTTDADARLYKKSYGKESKLSYLGHALVENRNGLIAAAMVTHADGYAERDAALLMLAEKQEGRSRRITVGADKAYDTKDFVSTVRELNVTPHITKNGKRLRSNLDRRTTRQPGYAVSLKHWPDPHFEKLSTEKKRKSQEKTLRCSDFQQVLRWISNARTFSTLRWWRSAPLKRALRNVSTNSQASAGPITCPPSEKTFMSSSSTPW